MNRELLIHLPVVIAVAHHRGFAAAASALNMSASAVSHAVRSVEDQIGQPLFARTTRSVSLTEAGQTFVSSVAPALEDIEKAMEALAARNGAVTGVLKINAPRVATPIVLTAILAKLAADHPQLVVEIHTNDAFVDIVEAGFDAGIRLGESIQQDMVAVRLTPPFKAIMVASPDYLLQRGTPRSIADLSMHNCIGFRLIASGGLYEWELQDGKKEIAVMTRGTAVVTDPTAARDLALASLGIAYIYEPLVRSDLQDGKLKWILQATAIEEGGLFLYFPKRASRAPKLRAFIETAKSLLAAG